MAWGHCRLIVIIIIFGCVFSPCPLYHVAPGDDQKKPGRGGRVIDYSEKTHYSSEGAIVCLHLFHSVSVNP
jgi:hypothetical protein